MVNLQFLGLEENMIEFIPDDVFVSQSLLESLNLEGNLIRKIGIDSFSSLVSFTRLKLAKNKLTNIDGGIFKKI